MENLKEGFLYLYHLIKIRISDEQDANDRSPLSTQCYPVCREQLYQELCSKHQMNDSEKMMLLTALAPVLHPELLELLMDEKVIKKLSKGAVGGYCKEPSRAFLPTCRTVVYLAGEGKEDTIYQCFSQEHFFFQHNILQLGTIEEGIPAVDAPIMLSEEYYHLFTAGIFQPRQSGKFPAQKIETQLQWEDLVISDKTMSGVSELNDWLKYESDILHKEGMKKWLKQGYRSIFYGPSGTGKSLTAALLGKAFSIPVYRTDLSMLVSKYIGETEKNMESLFNIAENKGWILFFDEAESLFGKRGSVSDANDRYANQEVSYLLQRIENYNGMVILASNKLFDIDEAFKRRFQSIIEFPEPGPVERLKLWRQMFSGIGFNLSDDVNLEELANTHRITGGIMINVLRSCALKAMVEKRDYFMHIDIVEAMKKEYAKHGWMWVDQPVQRNTIRIQKNVSMQ
jgi:hypothetical protein